MDRHDDEYPRAKDADEGREGFGDDMGTRVGRPDPGKGEGSGRESTHQGSEPSSQPVKEGLEGAAMDDEGDGKSEHPPEGKTGMGSEAAEGMHSAKGGRLPADSSGVESAGDEIGSRAGSDRRGSEPLEHRQRERSSHYGGEGGKPRQ